MVHNCPHLSLKSKASRRQTSLKQRCNDVKTLKRRRNNVILMSHVGWKDSEHTLDKIIMQIKLQTAPEIFAICKALFAVIGLEASGR